MSKNNTHMIDMKLAMPGLYDSRPYMIGAEVSMLDKQIALQKLLDNMIGSGSRRPYEKHFKEMAEMKKQNMFVKWIRENVFKSVFFLGLQWLLVIFLIQMVLILLQHFEVIDEKIFPPEIISIVNLNTLHFFLLPLSVTTVVTSNRAAIHSFLQNIIGWSSETNTFMLANIKEDINVSEKRHKILRYPEEWINENTWVEKIDTRTMLIEMRHITATIVYAVYKLGRKDFKLNIELMDTLNVNLKRELNYQSLNEDSLSMITKLHLMYVERLDKLYTSGSMSDKTQPSILAQAAALSNALGEFEYANNDLNQPKALINILTVTTWALLCYYPFVVFPSWGLSGTIVLMFIIDLLLHGMLMFVRVYNNPFELAALQRLNIVKFSDLAHDAVYNLDKLFLSALTNITKLQDRKENEMYDT